MKLRSLLLVAALPASCGPDAQAPVQVGFTGTCTLAVRSDAASYTNTFVTPDELKTRIVLNVVKDTLVGIHVEIPDTRTSSSFDKLPDNPLLVGDAKPDVVLDRDGDVDVTMQLHAKDARGEAQEPWELPVRVRFRGHTAEVVAGRMLAKGPCTSPPPPE